MNLKTLALVVVLALAVASGCDAGRDDSFEAEPLPSWIEQVQPQPGQKSSAPRIVEVRHRVMKGPEHVRLDIDGIDVTSFARLAPGVLHYDARQPTAPVRLEPGRHRATVKHVRLTQNERHRVLDSFIWSFEIL